MNRILQRAVALLLIPLTAFSIIINSYGTAYAAAVLPVTYGMGEVWWTLCASMGISFELTGTDAVQEFGKEMKDTFDLWVTDNGFDEIDANTIKEEIAGLPSKVKDGAMSLSQKAWGALKSFRKTLVKDFSNFEKYPLSGKVDSMHDVLSGLVPEGVDSGDTYQSLTSVCKSIVNYRMNFVLLYDSHDDVYYIVRFLGEFNRVELIVNGDYSDLHVYDSSGNEISVNGCYKFWNNINMPGWRYYTGLNGYLYSSCVVLATSCYAITSFPNSLSSLAHDLCPVCKKVAYN